MDSASEHPYLPHDLVLPDFAPNDRDLTSIATAFVAMWLVVFSSTWYLSTLCSPKLGTADKSIVLWFILCGTLHCFFEGYYVFNNTTFGHSQFLFAQLWKEYSLSDSRYVSGDPTVLCAETVTMVVWGPLSYVTAIMILLSSPYRHPLQAMVSLGHLYGDTLYISTSLVDLYVRGVSYSRPEPYYFWFYFLFLNLIWVFVPSILLYQSTKATATAFHAWQQIQYHRHERVEQGGQQVMKGPSKE